MGLAAAVLSAGSLAACDRGLPDTPPPDLRIVYSYNAGMLPRSHRLEIHGRAARYHETRGRSKPIEFTFRLTQDQLAGLYRTLRDNRLLEITSTDRGRVHDRGGANIRLSWSDRRHRLSNSGNQFVDKRWHTEFNAIRRAFEALIAEAKAKHSQSSR